MNWWKTALYDTCSLISLDKLLLERAGMARHFPTSIAALEESFKGDQLREDTGQRMRQRVTICPLPPPAKLDAILSSVSLSKALAEVDKWVYATAVHHKLAVVTADKRLAKAVQARGLQVSNVALVLRELVVAKKLTEGSCEKLLVGLVARKDFLLGTPTPTWADLRNHSFPD
jgi:predicted nucleic acid-binding protein